MADGSYQLSHRSGDVIDGKYRLLRCLGEGGTSWVWLAHHTALDLQVALKLAKPGCTRVGVALAEARMLASLDHPAIVRVMDSGRTVLGEPYLAMEHLHGEALATVLVRDVCLPATRTVRLLAPIFDATAYCHANGIVHRDIKPENIFLCRTANGTQPKLIDFGVARRTCGDDGEWGISGTPGYMAPEQVSDPMRVDLRSDIWALCAVLYELIAGTTAVQGDDWQRRLAMTTECEIPPLPAREAAATRLWPILERGLQRAPERRFASVGELRSALARWLDHEERRVETPVTHALPQRSAPRPRRQLQWAQAYHPTAT